MVISKLADTCKVFANIEAYKIGAVKPAKNALQNGCTKGVTTAIEQVIPICEAFAVTERIALEGSSIIEQSLKKMCIDGVIAGLTLGQ